MSTPNLSFSAPCAERRAESKMWFHNRPSSMGTSGEGSLVIDRVIAAVGGCEALRQIPELPWQDEFLGPGGHSIDRILPSDFPETGPSVVTGQDPSGRGFISFCVTAVMQTQGFSKDSNTFTGVQTLQQYNSDECSQWRATAFSYPTKDAQRDNPSTFCFPFPVCPVSMLDGSELGPVKPLLEGKPVTVGIPMNCNDKLQHLATVRLTSSPSRTEENS